MGQVLKLSNARIEKPRPQSGLNTGKYYYCTRCGAERFKLAANGYIYCGPCGSWMKNIEVLPKATNGNPMEG